MSAFLILGAGPIGRAAAAALLDLGHKVTVGTRSGTRVPSTAALTIDAANTPALTSAAQGIDAMIICTNPPYHRWPVEWPPIIRSAISAAKATGARIVLMSNLYSYGKPAGRITDATPTAPTESKGRTRAELWDLLLAAHRAAGIGVTELRASDYFGPDAGPNVHLGSRFLAPVRKGKTASIIGDPDAPHSWSYLPDIGRCLAILATRRINPRAKVRQIPAALLAVVGLFSPLAREVRAIRYQFTEPFLLSDSELRAAFDFTPTPLEQALEKAS